MKVKVCCGWSCKEKFSEYILTRLENDKKRDNLNSLIIEKWVCMGKCSEWPNVEIDWRIEKYMQPAKVSEIVSEKLK